MSDPLTATFHPGGRFACPVTGCGWVLDVPEPELVDLGTYGDPHRVRHVGAPREQVDAYLASHADWHAALTETGVDPGDRCECGAELQPGARWCPSCEHRERSWTRIP